MDDLRVPPGPGVPAGLVIPATDLVERFSRSPGPGGQSVNTTDSRVELEYDVAGSAVLSDGQRARLLSRLSGPVIRVVAAEHRSQHRNRVAARDRLAEQVRAGLAPRPPKRRPTKPTRGSQQRRLNAKKQRGATKSLRGRVRDD